MKVVVVGTGYVGLVTGACLADVGNHVVCVDVDKKKIERLKTGIIPIYEPGLESIVKKNYQRGNLQFSDNIKQAGKDKDIFFIAVGTPPGEDGSADLKYVLQVARDIASIMIKEAVVVTKSTVPVGTAELVRKEIRSVQEQLGKHVPFYMASNPEFLKEGAAIDDFMKPDRIVIGIDSGKAKISMEKLYHPFTLNGHPIYFMDIPSAEMTKYAANAMLATRISFMNDIANLCEKVGADVNMVRTGIGSDPRIGSQFLYPGIGYGGSCFPKDVRALTKTGKEAGHELRILEAVEQVNRDQKLRIFNKLKNRFGDLQGKTVAVWGLSFKPNTDDMREAPSIEIVKALEREGAKVRAFDPVAIHEASKILNEYSVEFGSNEYEILDGASALLLLTEWREFRMPDLNRIKALLKEPVIYDGRNIYDPSEMRKQGFEYYGIGIQ